MRIKVIEKTRRGFPATDYDLQIFFLNFNAFLADMAFENFIKKFNNNNLTI
jgi:hypothetical protein